MPFLSNICIWMMMTRGNRWYLEGEGRIEIRQQWIRLRQKIELIKHLRCRDGVAMRDRGRNIKAVMVERLRLLFCCRSIWKANQNIASILLFCKMFYWCRWVQHEPVSVDGNVGACRPVWFAYVTVLAHYFVTEMSKQKTRPNRKTRIDLEVIQQTAWSLGGFLFTSSPITCGLCFERHNDTFPTSAYDCFLLYFAPGQTCAGFMSDIEVGVVCVVIHLSSRVTLSTVCSQRRYTSPHRVH